MDTGRGGARRCSRVLVVDREGERAEGIGTEGEIRESERVRGGRVASPGGSGGKQGGRRWPGRVAARAGRVPVLLAEEEGDRGGSGGGLGRAGPGKWAPGNFLLSLSLLVSVFYFFLSLF